MRRFKILLVALAILLVLGGVARAAPGEKWGPRADGWYAPSKLAAEIKDYGVDWSAELASDKTRGWQAGDDTITSCTWAYGTGLTGASASISLGRVTITWLSGGTAGQTYDVSLTLHTVGGRTMVFPFKIQVK